MSSRNAPPRGALRDDTKNGCVADYLKASIRDFQAKWGRDSGLKVGTRCGMPKITLGITGLSKNLGQAA